MGDVASLCASAGGVSRGALVDASLGLPHSVYGRGPIASAAGNDGRAGEHSTGEGSTAAARADATGGGGAGLQLAATCEMDLSGASGNPGGVDDRRRVRDLCLLFLSAAGRAASGECGGDHTFRFLRADAPANLAGDHLGLAARQSLHTAASAADRD